MISVNLSSAVLVIMLRRGLALAPHCLAGARGARLSSGKTDDFRQWTRLAKRGAWLAVTGSLLLCVWRRGTRKEAGQVY